ncbi:MAG TPA: response regulator [Vicinamibacterales bacterium]|nr:response regulator [Vicinamibacterales bacterium]
MTEDSRKPRADRRRVPRGGRRATDRTGKHPAVLIAESYEGVRQSCSRYLDRFHFQVAEAADGEQAIARIAAEPPEVILTELNLPAMPAWRLKQWLSQSWRTRQIPIIVMADNLDTSAVEELRNQMAGVLMKPFPLGRMLDEIRRTLRVAAVEGDGEAPSV